MKISIVDVGGMVRTALFSSSPMRRAEAQAALIELDLPVSPQALVIAAERIAAIERERFAAAMDSPKARSTRLGER